MFSSTCFAEDKDNVSRDTPVKEGPLAEVSDSSNYFSNYAKGKAMTEHAIESWVQSRLFNQANDETEVDSIRVVILRPGTAAPSMGLDGVPVGWHTDTKSLAAGIKLSYSSSIFGKVMKTVYARKGVDTGVIPVNHVANMIVLAGGNCNLKGIDGKPFYLNACSPSKREATWDTFYERDTVMVPEDLSTYENDLKEALVRAKSELGYSERKMRALHAVEKACETFTWLSFHDWAFETSSQAMLYDGLYPEYRIMMPICFVDNEEMNAWVDEIMFKMPGEEENCQLQARTRCQC